jgi:hypothetical protein
MRRRTHTRPALDGDGPSQAGNVAERLQRKISSLGPTRAGLIAFTVPGMADFISRQAEQ